MPKVGVVFNDAKPIAEQTAVTIEAWLQERGWDAVLTTGRGGLLGYASPDSISYTPIEDLVPPEFKQDITFVVSLGGDGTVLSTFRQVAPLGLPVLAINTGHMGFLTETYLSHWEDALDRMVQGSYIVEQRSMMRVRAYDGEEVFWEALALNEMVLHREPLTSMCHFEVSIGNHAPVDIAADGIIISTPTGSTAYALSAGGTVIEPGIPVFQLVPICPHSMASRALVFANSEKVVVTSADRHRLVMVLDGNAGCYIYPEYKLVLDRSIYPARFARLRPGEFFNVLREKLGWGLPHISKPTSVELP
ncbi:MAG: NAD(+) kinase [Cyanobacteria bacterium M5B4]|nr:NAD(+) kinase [Cyanobacteria bacterium KgW148]PLS68872.1 MAG: NAD(+) kinase [Cyanobacteria bacterium M5B4]